MATRRRRTSEASARKKPAERTGLGGGSVDRHLEKSGKRRKSNIYTSVGDGNTIIVRAVDTKKYFKDGYVHPVEFERKDGSTFTMDIRCLDPEDEGNPCPGCRDDLERRYKFWMIVIHRDAEKENKAGKVIGEEDQVRILSGASRLVKALNAKHRRRDLAKRDVEISQNGTSFDVEYEVEWADEEDVPLTEEDEELIENATEIFEAFDRYTEIRDEEDFYDLPQFSNGDDDEDIGERSKRRGSVFKERKKKTSGFGKKRAVEEDDDEEEDDEDEEEEIKPRSRQRRTSSKKSASSSKATIRKSTRRRTR